MNAEPSVPDRRIYRNRGLMWASLITAGLAAAVILVPLATGTDEGPADAIGVSLAAVLMAAVMLWIGFRPRTVIGPEHLTHYSFFSRRTVAWADIQAVQVNRDPATGTDSIVLTVAGAEVRVPVPGINSVGIGRGYMTRAAADIETTWRAETDGNSASEQLQ